MDKLVLIISLLLACPLALSADNWKIIEASEKKAPQWLGSNPEGFLEISSEGKSLEECRQEAQRQLLKEIIMAVATNVETKSLHKSSESFDGSNVSSSEDFNASTEIYAARLPFIQGVSLSEAAGSYWVKLREKGSNREVWRLSVLYPLPADRLAWMRAEFERIDAEKRAQLKVLKEQVVNVSSAAQISEADATLQALQEYFFDAVRRSEARELQKQYNALYKSITMSGEVVRPGVAQVRILLNGKPFAGGGRLKVVSDCASDINASPLEDGSTWQITYSTQDCLPLEPNSLKISMNIKTARLSLQLSI